MIDDIDTEFLHDYRVAIRRIRSLLTLVRKVFPAAVSRGLRRRFGELARDTNRLRDIDVYLLSEDHYRAQLPPGLRPELDPMFDELRRERKRELARLRRRWRSVSYREEMAAIDDWFAGDMPAGTRADSPIGALAAREVDRAYRRVAAAGLKVDEDTPHEDVHALRIECKKLRYLLEWFEPLFAALPYRQVVRRLKRLQTVLGSFNDFSTQQLALQQYLDRGPRDNRAAAAVGGLIASLYRQQGEARAQVVERFASFNGGTVRGHIAAISAAAGKGASE
jgi:CHAD domain-containing protein